MAEREITKRLRANIPGWVSIAIVTFGALIGIYVALEVGRAEMSVRVERLEADVERLETDSRDLRSRATRLESSEHNHNRRR